MCKHTLMIVVVIGLLTMSQLTAVATTIDFESLFDGDLVTNQFPGLTFSNATALTAGITLNEFEFPPNSGVNVVADEGGPISIAFTTPATAVSGFFTYLIPLTLTAFDAANTAVAMDTSDFNSNLVLSGDPMSLPNELLTVAFAGGISRVTIEGDPLGGSFALDDLTFTQITTPIPEPSTLLLFVAGIAGLLGWRGARFLIEKGCA